MVDLRKRGFANRIIGVDTNLNHQNIALLCGLVDENDTLENAIEKSDLIILSTPVQIRYKNDTMVHNTKLPHIPSYFLGMVDSHNHPSIIS